MSTNIVLQGDLLQKTIIVGVEIRHSFKSRGFFRAMGQYVSGFYVGVYCGHQIPCVQRLNLMPSISVAVVSYKAHLFSN